MPFKSIDPPFCDRHVYSVHLHYTMIELAKVLEIWATNRTESTMQRKKQLRNNEQIKKTERIAIDRNSNIQYSWSFLWWTIKLEFNVIQWWWMLWSIEIKNLNWIFIRPLTNGWMSFTDVSVVKRYVLCVCMYVSVRLYFMESERIINEPLQCLPRVSCFLLRSFFKQFVCGFFLSSLHSLTQPNLKFKSNCTYQTLNIFYVWFYCHGHCSHFEWQITRKIWM